ncbi:MAG: cation:proton antiporter regulatory subunit [Actinomycetota bacterium]
MAEVEETALPGVGIRYDFLTGAGRRIGVLLHRSGRRDLLVYDAADPDECAVSIDLGLDDAHTLAELLGASRVVEALTSLHHDIEGLSIDWIEIDPGAEWAGQRLREAAVHTAIGVSVVALIGADGVTVAPGAEDVLTPGVTAVAVGTRQGVEALAQRLRTS